MRVMGASSRQAAGILLLLLVVAVPTAQGRSRKQIVELVNVSIDNILANLNELHGIVITTPKPMTTPAVTAPTTTAAVLSTTTTAAGPETTTTPAVPTTTTAAMLSTTTTTAVSTTNTTEGTATESSGAPTTTAETATESSNSTTATDEPTTESSDSTTDTDKPATESSDSTTDTDEPTTESSDSTTDTDKPTTESYDSTAESSMLMISTTTETTRAPTNATIIRRRVRSLRQALDRGSSGSGPLETWRSLKDENSTVDCNNDANCVKLESALDDVDKIVSEMNDGEINDGQVDRADNADKDVAEVVKTAQADPDLQALLNDNVGYIESEIESIKDDKKDIQELFDNLKSKETLGIVLGSIAGALVLIGLVGAGYFFYQKRRKNAVPKDSTSEE